MLPLRHLLLPESIILGLQLLVAVVKILVTLPAPLQHFLSPSQLLLECLHFPGGSAVRIPTARPLQFLILELESLDLLQLGLSLLSETLQILLLLGLGPLQTNLELLGLLRLLLEQSSIAFQLPRHKIRDEGMNEGRRGKERKERERGEREEREERKKMI